MYGEPLRLPGDLFSSVADDGADHCSLLARLRQHFAQVRPTPASRHANPGVFVHRDLAKCSHVFLRVDRVRRSLTPPYTGPHRVIDRDSRGKTMTIEVRGKGITVSIDRVKPAFSLPDSPEARPPLRQPPPVAPEPRPPARRSTTEPEGRRNPRRRVCFSGAYTAAVASPQEGGVAASAAPHFK